MNSEVFVIQSADVPSLRFVESVNRLAKIYSKITILLDPPIFPVKLFAETQLAEISRHAFPPDMPLEVKFPRQSLLEDIPRGSNLILFSEQTDESSVILWELNKRRPDILALEITPRGKVFVENAEIYKWLEKTRWEGFLPHLLPLSACLAIINKSPGRFLCQRWVALCKELGLPQGLPEPYEFWMDPSFVTPSLNFYVAILLLEKYRSPLLEEAEKERANGGPDILARTELRLFYRNLFPGWLHQEDRPKSGFKASMEPPPEVQRILDLPTALDSFEALLFEDLGAAFLSVEWWPVYYGIQSVMANSGQPKDEYMQGLKNRLTQKLCHAPFQTKTFFDALSTQYYANVNRAIALANSSVEKSEKDIV